MTFNELLEQSGMNTTDFAKYFGIPRRTVQNWKLGLSKCPSYVLELIKYRLDIEYPKREYIKIKTNDFSPTALHKILCKNFGERFIDLNEIEDALNDGTIEMCEDGIIVK